MSTSLLPVSLPADTWVDLYLSTGISVGTQLIIQNRRTDDVFLSESAIEPSGLIEDLGGNKLVGKEFYSNAQGSVGAWAYSAKGGSIQVGSSSSHGFSPYIMPFSNGGSTAEYGLNIQRGLVPDVGIVHIFGRNPDIDTSSGFEDIWNGGGDYTGFNATQAETISITSSSADDTNVTGTGAWIAQVVGLDGSYNEINEIIALNGINPVVTTQAFLRCATVLILTAGSGQENVGSITGRQSTTTANVFFVAPPTSNRSLICAYTVPANKQAFITGGFATLAKKGNASSEIKASVRFPGSVFQVVEWFAVDGAGSSYVYRDFEIPLIGVPTGTDIRVQADADTNNIGIAAGLEIFIVDV